MTEFTDEQLGKICRVIESEVGQEFAEKILDKLRPKPKFAKGQVVFLLHGHFGGTYHDADFVRGKPVRALTPTEMGPLALELFKYVKDSETSTMSHTYAVDLIKRFKEVHGDA